MTGPARRASLVLKHQYDADADPFAEAESVTVESIRYLSPVSGGSHIELLDLRGDLSEATEILGADDRIRSYDVAGRNGTGVAYLQRRSSGVVGQLLSTIYGHDLVVDWPLEYRVLGETAESEFSVVGTDASLQRTVAEFPEGVTVELQRIGNLEGEQADASRTLTSQQRELLELAFREGYYDVPRQTTHGELAEELDLSAGTVSDRLQRIERRLVASHLGR